MSKKKSKNKSKKNVQHKRIEKEIDSQSIDMVKAVKCLIVVLLFFGLFYLLAIYITNKKDNNTNNQQTNEEIQYKEILLGTSFSKDSNDYIVVYYNKNVNSDIINALATYRTKDKHVTIYEVDMSNAMNKEYANSESNKVATKATELKINGTTLIRFKNHKIAEYIESNDSVINYLSSN